MIGSSSRRAVTPRSVASSIAAVDSTCDSRLSILRVMASPGLLEKFRVPHNQSNQAVLAAARAFAAAALPLKAEFVKRGMRPDAASNSRAELCTGAPSDRNR